MDFKYFNQTTKRTLDVLQSLSESEHGKTLGELREELECSKSSLFPILKTMGEAGYIHSSAAEVRYKLTTKIYELVRHHSSRRSLVGAFESVSRQAVAEIQETMQIAVLNATNIVYIAKQESNHPVHLVSEVGRSLPSHATALGKCLLSSLEDREILERYEGVPIQIFTTKTVSTMDSLLAAIKKARENGYAEDWQEISEGLCCIAAPIRNGFGDTMAAASFAVPLHRATPDHWSSLRQKILEAAAAISAELGYIEAPSAKDGMVTS